MQHTHAKTAGAVAVRKTEVGPAPIWVLVAGVVLLLVALGPSFVTPTATSPVRPAAAAVSTGAGAATNASPIGTDGR